MSNAGYGEQDKRTPEEINRDLERTRAELTDTINELMDRVDPRSSVKEAANTAKSKLADLKDAATKKASEVTDRAREAADEARAKFDEATDETSSDAFSSALNLNDESSLKPAAIIDDAESGDSNARGVLISLGVAAAGLLIWGIGKARS